MRPLSAGSRDRLSGPSTTPIFRTSTTPYNRRLEAAARLSGAQRYSAYAFLDADLARKMAPFAVLFNPSELDFFSARMGCQVYQPIYGVDLAALCIRGEGQRRGTR
jgi:hypothetical protein